MTENETNINASEVCYRAFQLMASKQFSEAEKLISSNMSRTKDDPSVALYHSALGVLYKMQGEYKTAWRHYQRAEKLLPEDPALKLISARLLIDQFAEFDQAVKKAKKVLSLIPDSPGFKHQAYTIIGLAFAKEGKRRDALKALESSMVDDFKTFITAQNIDLSLVEALLKKGWGEEICRKFLQRALEFAKTTKEEHYIELFTKLNYAFEKEFPQNNFPSGNDEETNSGILQNN